ncbi:hypothetical protein TRFO_07948 [Tritrichomonas foetus]|uniref:Uncharacterized protein n=1 Tax=Tritrichomonas foetus TaxID=1144522 RepID=A0A1J4JPH3_9EUKA|nr:hypothetical protein TRFO_07948 [Tritrichomonas foetus]|eukprot:OHT00296.1 hypothetical protein TRFO_07948 [Tritrichomonas foetus]
MRRPEHSANQTVDALIQEKHYAKHVLKLQKASPTINAKQPKIPIHMHLTNIINMEKRVDAFNQANLLYSLIPSKSNPHPTPPRAREYKEVIKKAKTRPVSPRSEAKQSALKRGKNSQFFLTQSIPELGVSNFECNTPSVDKDITNRNLHSENTKSSLRNRPLNQYDFDSNEFTTPKKISTTRKQLKRPIHESYTSPYRKSDLSHKKLINTKFYQRFYKTEFEREKQREKSFAQLDDDRTEFDSPIDDILKKSSKMLVPSSLKENVQSNENAQDSKDSEPKYLSENDNSNTEELIIDSNHSSSAHSKNEHDLSTNDTCNRDIKDRNTEINDSDTDIRDSNVEIKDSNIESLENSTKYADEINKNVSSIANSDEVQASEFQDDQNTVISEKQNEENNNCDTFDNVDSSSRNSESQQSNKSCNSSHDDDDQKIDNQTSNNDDSDDNLTYMNNSETNNSSKVENLNDHETNKGDDESNCADYEETKIENEDHLHNDENNEISTETDINKNVNSPVDEEVKDPNDEENNQEQTNKNEKETTQSVTELPRKSNNYVENEPKSKNKGLPSIPNLDTKSLENDLANFDSEYNSHSISAAHDSDTHNKSKQKECETNEKSNDFNRILDKSSQLRQQNFDSDTSKTFNEDFSNGKLENRENNEPSKIAYSNIAPQGDENEQFEENTTIKKKRKKVLKKKLRKVKVHHDQNE